MPIPKPGKPVRGPKSGAPVMAVFDLLGRRWAMGIIWQLAPGPMAFVELQKACGNISPTILSSRIKDLTEAMLVTQTLQGYTLTPTGLDLFRLLEPFQDWALLWAKQLKS